MNPYPNTLQEEELKKQVAHDIFPQFDCRRNLGRVDFAVAVNDPVAGYALQFDDEPVFLLWAEAKRGTKQPLLDSLIQLVLTIGKERTFNQQLPPNFLGAFDAEKICFIQYHTVADVFFQSDFNWNVTPSDHASKEFRQLSDMIGPQLKRGACLFHYDTDEKDLREFIRQNFRTGKQQLSRIRITKNNFTAIYQKWVKSVMPTIGADWEKARKGGILDSDFFLADILSTENNSSIIDKLYVVLQGDHYIFAREEDEFGFFNSKRAEFTDGGVAHRQFWNRYKRPPRKEWWDFMIGRRDLLVPQDVRERKGSYFTPQQWVELSREYLEGFLGEDWQEEHYIWDCCAGTGNMLTNLNCPERVFASTLDKADVDVMQQLREGRTLNLLEGHIFRFDFLNDPFDADHLPAPLLSVLQDPAKRKKLIIYINPPYAEHTNSRTRTGTGENRLELANTSAVYTHMKDEGLGTAARELYVQFFYRIYKEIPGCIVGNFSTLKILQAPYHAKFRAFFKAKLERLFLMPANTFDNVDGKFPIGFHIWNLDGKSQFKEIESAVYNKLANIEGTKLVAAPPTNGLIVDWLKTMHDSGERVSYLRTVGSDFQNQNGVYLTNAPSANDIKARLTHDVTAQNLIPICVYYSVRKVVEATWLNDRDQFLFPNGGWASDREFQADCLAFALFHGQNRISAAAGVNHWLPFSPQEVGAKEAFQSTFMRDFILGRLAPKAQQQQIQYGDAPSASPLQDPYDGSQPVAFSPEAQAVMHTARDLFAYYHRQDGATNDASFYDLRRHFQGLKLNPKTGKESMNPSSADPAYNSLLSLLRQAQKSLAQKIEPKVYEYGFLK